MFKKITSVILVLVLVFSLAGCAQPNTGSNGDNNVGSNLSATGESTGSQNVETDENLLAVDITLPATLFEGQDMTVFDTEEYAKEQGFISAKVNEDGSLTVTMTKGKHKELLNEMAATVDASFAELICGEYTPYIKDISHNDDFTSVIMKVDSTAYENAFDLTPFTIGLSVAMYQAFTGIEYHVEIAIVDATSGETIKTVTYPEALEK